MKTQPNLNQGEAIRSTDTRAGERRGEMRGSNQALESGNGGQVEKRVI